MRGLWGCLLVLFVEVGITGVREGGGIWKRGMI